MSAPNLKTSASVIRIRPEKMTQLLMDQSALSVRPATEISLATRSAYQMG